MQKRTQKKTRPLEKPKKEPPPPPPSSVVSLRLLGAEPQKEPFIESLPKKNIYTYI